MGGPDARAPRLRCRRGPPVTVLVAASCCGLVATFLCAGSTGGPPPPVTALAFAPGGDELVAGSQRGARVLTWPGLELVRSLEPTLKHVHDLAFSPAGDRLLLAGGAPAEEGAVEERRWPSGDLVRRLAPHKDLIYKVAWSPDGALWASASWDTTVRIHGAATGEEVATYSGHSRPVLAVTFLGRDGLVASAGVDNTVRLWEAATGKHVRTLDQHLAPVLDLALRPRRGQGTEPELASAGEDHTVRLWQPLRGRLLRFKRLPSTPTALAWTSSGSLLVAGTGDGKIHALDPETMEESGTADPGPSPVASLAAPPVRAGESSRDAEVAAGSTVVSRARLQGEKAR